MFFDFETFAKKVIEKGEQYPPICEYHRKVLKDSAKEVLMCIECNKQVVEFYEALLMAYPILQVMLPNSKKIMQLLKERKEHYAGTQND